jgi:hypothetical protein
VTLAATVNTTFDRIFQRHRVSVFLGHRLPLTGSRWDLPWLIGRGLKPTSCVLPVLGLAVMEKSCDACGEGKYYFRSAFWVPEGACVLESSIAFDRKSMGHTVADGSSNEADFCVLPVYSVTAMEKSCDACGDGNAISGRLLRRHRVPDFQRHRMQLTGSRLDLQWLIGRRTRPTACVFPVFSVTAMEKSCDAGGDGERYLRSGFFA